MPKRGTTVALPWSRESRGPGVPSQHPAYTAGKCAQYARRVRSAPRLRGRRVRIFCKMTRVECSPALMCLSVPKDGTTNLALQKAVGRTCNNYESRMPMLTHEGRWNNVAAQV